MENMPEFNDLTADQAKVFIKDSEGWVVRDIIARMINDAIPDRILDVGCGNGNCASRYSPEKYVGLDVSASLLNAAKIQNPKHIFMQGNAGFLPFHDKTFDYVFCISLLEHLHTLSDAREVLLEMIRVASKKVYVNWHKIPILGGPTKIRSWKDSTERHFGMTVYSNIYNIYDLTYGILDVAAVTQYNVNATTAVWEVKING